MSRTGGLKGMQYQKKSFTDVGPGDDMVIRNVMSDVEREKGIELNADSSVQIVKPNGNKGTKIIPFGDRILVQRRKVGEKAGNAGIILPGRVAEHDTDLADVVFIPDLTFADKQLIDNSIDIINSLTSKARGGDAQAFQALLDFNRYLKVKTLQVGDAVMISKYVGTQFFDNHSQQTYTLVSENDIIGMLSDAHGVETERISEQIVE